MKKPVELAGLYLQNGAAAVSVLTDERYFQGHLDYLREISASYPESPTLRKDFIFDVYQIYEARAAGASAVLLIASMLNEEKIALIQECCQDLGMAALVEVHSTEEVEKALRCHSQIIGVNHRNLKDFSVDAENGLRLRSLIPPGIITVSESGIRSARDVKILAEAGFDAILVGEALVKAADIGKKTRELSRLGG
jgi:indole-3-glycerol phosphate synthase